jgi:flagellar protein FliT
MDQDDLLASYEAAANFTGKMLAAARASEWGRFAVLEAACASEVQRAKVGDARKPLTPQQRNRKIEVIRTILANDREIRLITESWMSELSTLLGGTAASWNASKTYDHAAIG